MVIGVDEAGRGPVMGPLVVSAAGLDDPDSLGSLGVKDSKMLTPARRDSLYTLLSGMMTGAILVVPADVIDRAREKMTMNRLEVLCFSSVLASSLGGRSIIHDEIPEDATIFMIGNGPLSGPVILDAADVNEERFGAEIGSCLLEILPGDVPELISRHKADRDHPVVGAASIFAKVTRDREMERISGELGEKTGSGYPSDPSTRRFLSDWVNEHGDLPPYCRRSWKTAQRLLGSGKQTDIFSFGQD